MSKSPLSTNQRHIEEMKESLGIIEVELLSYKMNNIKIAELIEIGYWINELLQTRISFKEREELFKLVSYVKYLQIVYLESSLDLCANQLSKRLKGLIDKEAWQIYLKLDEVRSIEREFFQGKDYHRDFNLDLVHLEQELMARLSVIECKI
ncbi:MAG: hypothetical protein KAX49_11690 [Halanaerobiales bacterium]|nr:hypothetical protein [Halanaerobiales bacterium]